MLPEMYKPNLLPHSEILQKEQLHRSKQHKNFNKCHRARQLKALQTGNQVWIPEFQQQATVLRKVAPRSYLVQTPRGRMRRNWQQLTLLNTTENIPSNESGAVTDSVIPTSPEDIPHHTPPGVTITRSGCVSKPPDRLNCNTFSSFMSKGDEYIIVVGCMHVCIIIITYALLDILSHDPVCTTIPTNDIGYS